MFIALVLAMASVGPVTDEPTDFSGESQLLVAPLRSAMCCALSPDGKWIAAGFGHASHRGLIRVADATTGKVKWEAIQERGVKAIVISPDGTIVASGNYGGQIRLRDAASGDVKLEMRESGSILGLAFSPDGLQLASASISRVVRLWDAKTGKTLRTVLGHTGNVNSVQFSVDGEQLLTASADKTVRLSSSQDGRVLQTFQHPDGVPSAIFLPGKRIATACADGNLRVYSLDDGSLVTTLAASARLPPAIPQSVSASGDGQCLAFNCGSSIHVCEIDTWRFLATLDDHDDLVASVVLSANGQTLASAGADSIVRVWDVPSQKTRHVLNLPDEEMGIGGPVRAAAVAPDGKLIAVVSGDGPIRLHDRTTGAVVRSLQNSEGAMSFAFSPDGQTLAVGSNDGSLRLWNVANGEAKEPLVAENAMAIMSLAWSPRGDSIAAASPESNLIFLWDLATKKAFTEHDSQTSSLAFTPDGKQLVVGSGIAGAAICDLDQRPIVHTPIAHEGPVRAVAVSPDGATIVTAGDDLVVNLWDAKTLELRAAMQGHQQAVATLAFSPQGKTLASGGAGGGVMLWDVGRGVARKTLNGHTGNVAALTFLPDGLGIVSGSIDETVRLWKANVGVIAPLASMPAHQPKAFAVKFSPDGKWLASGGDNKVVTLRDPTTGAVKKTLSGHSGLVFDVTFSPDSTHLASASADGTVRVWQVPSGTLVASYEAWGPRRSNIRSVAFSTDGREIASGSEDGAITLWNVADEKVRQKLPIQALPVLCVRYSPEGSLLATCTGINQRPKEMGELRLWDSNSGKEIAALEGHTSEIKRVAFDDSGRRMASVGERSVIVWNVTQRTIEAKFEADAVLTAIAFLGNGDLLAAGDARGGVAIYSIERGAVVHRYAGHGNIIPAIAVRPDQQVMATASHDGTMKLWPGPAALRAEAK